MKDAYKALRDERPVDALCAEFKLVVWQALDGLELGAQLNKLVAMLGTRLGIGVKHLQRGQADRSGGRRRHQRKAE